MKTRPFPSPLGRVLHAALDRLSLHHISHQAVRRGYMLCEDDGETGEAPWDLDTAEFYEAQACFRAGDIAEAMIWLERALPDTFAGLSDRVVPRRGSEVRR